MKVLIFEQWHGGHYLNYLNALVPELARLSGTLVIAVGEELRGSPAALGKWSAHGNVGFARTLPHVSPRLAAADRYAAVRNLVACLREVRPDFTILPSADAQAIGAAALDALGFDVRKRFGPIEGTLHYGYGDAAVTRNERLKELLYSHTYRRLPFSSVNFVNFAYYEYAAAAGLIPPDRLRFVGDPVPQPKRIGREAARKLLGLDPAGRYLGLLGSLDRRKAIPQLLAAFRAAGLPREDRLLLAGRLDPIFAALIEDEYADLVRSGCLVVFDRFLSDAELENGYEALDLATVVYNRFPGLASLALKAVAAGTPVIAHDFGWLRAAITRFEIGERIDIFDTPAFAAALRTTLDRGQIDKSSEAVRRLLLFHTEANFVAQMTQGLRRSAGLLPASILEWDWVLEALPEERRMLR